MLSINDKLRLITEGYSIDEINNNQVGFTNLITESSRGYNEISMMLESINADFAFMHETNIIYLQESALDTLKEKIKRFIAWITEKIMNVIRWIKGKFFKKTQEVSAISVKVQKKVKSGELKEKISAIKSGDTERYKELKAKYRSTSGSDGKIEFDIKKLRGNGITDPDEFDKFVNNSMRDGNDSSTDTIPQKEILKVNIKQKIIDNNVPDIAQIATNITRIINTSLTNVENFRSALIRGTSNGQLNTEDNTIDLLLNLSTGNKVNDMKQLRGYVLGEVKEVELSVDHVEKVSDLLHKFEKEGEEIFKAYNETKNLLDKWKDQSIGIIEKYKDGSEIRPESISKRVQQMIQLITGAISILNALLSFKSDGLTDCELVLKKLDSL
jgi:hypothetical protein